MIEKTPSIDSLMNLDAPNVEEETRRSTESFMLSDAGKASLVRSDYTAAEGAFRQALHLYKSNLWAVIGTGIVLEHQDRPREALEAYRQVFSDQANTGFYSNAPWPVEAMARYGLLAEGAGQWNEAVKVYEKARDSLNSCYYPVPNAQSDQEVSQPKQLRAMLHALRGLTLEAQGKGEEALSAYAEAAREQPDQPLVQFYLGHGLRKAGRAAEARAAFQRAARFGSGAVQAEARKAMR